MSSFERNAFTDQLNIETPEQVALHYNVAGIGSRFVAVLVDTLLLIAVYVVEIVVLIVIASSGAHRAGSGAGLGTAGKWLLAGFILLNFCFFGGYFSLFEAYWHGQTPGKRIMKLRVIKDSGRQITLFESLARNLVRLVDYLPAGYLVGLITMLCNKSHKRLGDFAAGTIVVHERLEDQPLMVQPGATLLPRSVAAPWEPEPWMAAVPALFPADAIAKLGTQDLVVIEAFFARALDLTVEVRAAMGERIARQMAAKMGVALPEGNPERALESIAFAMRGSGRAFS